MHNNSSSLHTEKIFEDELCAHLASHGWTVRTHLKDAVTYQRELALYPDDLLAYVQDTQPAEWAKFKKWHNGQSETVFLKRVAEQLDKHGTLWLLRRGFKDRDAKFSLCQFRPATAKNAALQAAYDKNRLTVIRQLHYSVHNENSLDLVLFVNGLPVATAELKTDLTQSIEHAVAQYRRDRRPKDAPSRELEPLLQFKTRALVHFAVSTTEVRMTTKLAGDATTFLPFNLGAPDGLGGATAGNPPAPAGKGYPTWYLWEYVWGREVWLDLLGNFLHLDQKRVEKVPGKPTTEEVLIFPRFHQLDAVKKLIYAAYQEGPGHNYLIQHSAGSGKSNTIAWTVHQLASLHAPQGQKCFDSVIVVTDRKVLDSQLQDTIRQFAQVSGVVQAIDQNSQQLAQALNDGAAIIVTTLQKFPYILGKVGHMADKRFALVIDEAHSSQSGDAARKLRYALVPEAPPPLTVRIEGEERTVFPDVEIEGDDVTTEDLVNEVMAASTRPPNLSYFAFTATPKAKTLELFGRPDEEGRPVPFHVYSMRQAIDEGFIMDVLANYVTYESYFNLGSKADEKLVPAGKAKRSLARYAQLHHTSIAQKVAIIVEHFRTKVMSRIGGRAKAMVVTSGRLAAVRYKLAVDKYLKEMAATDPAYQQMGTLVAFSGKVEDPELMPGSVFTETGMNPSGTGSIAETFKDDEYRLLLVANKFQTGFDQPLLHTMYVDKVLSGVMAVQTLSRLNRVFPGKEETFVLDFVNKPEVILASFLPYYRTASLQDVTDPNSVHELQITLDEAQVYQRSEVEALSRALHNAKLKQAAVIGHCVPGYERWKALPKAEAETFRKNLNSFVRLYSFLSQLIDYQDAELDALYAYGRYLLRLTSHGVQEVIPDLSGDVALTYYRVQKQDEQKLKLESGEVVLLQPMTGAGRKGTEDEKQALREVVEELNLLFGGRFTEADRVGFVTTLNGRLLQNERLAEQAASNTESQFALGDFPEILTDMIIEGQDAHNAIADLLLQDKRVYEAIVQKMAKVAYQAFSARKNRKGMQAAA